MPSSTRADRIADQLQEFIYGTLTVMVAIGGLTGSSVEPEPGRAIAVILGVAFATVLAHTFAALIATHVTLGRPVRRFEAIREFRSSWRIVTAATPSVVLLALAALGVFSTRTAMRASVGLAVAALIVVAFVASRRSHSSAFSTFVFVSIATLMGLSIVAIEIYVHHL